MHARSTISPGIVVSHIHISLDLMTKDIVVVVVVVGVIVIVIVIVMMTINQPPRHSSSRMLVLYFFTLTFCFLITFNYLITLTFYYFFQGIFRRIATLLQRSISCGDAHEDTRAALELTRTHSREGQVYTR